MPKLKPRELAAEARRRNLAQVADLGRDLRHARTRRRLTQADVASAAGIGRSTVAAIELGRGGSHTLDAWQRLALAVGRPLLVHLERDALGDPADAGHLAIQELVLRLARQRGIRGTFELSTRPSEPRRSTDVGLRDDRVRRLVLIECWNSVGDLGAAARSANRKIAEADAYATAIWGDRPHEVASCWIVRATRVNRALVARYPALFAARFPGSSARWTNFLNGAAPEPPREPGLVWCDVAATRLFAHRQRAGPSVA